MNPQNQEPIYPSLLKVKTKDVEIKDLKYEAEKHDYENIFKSLESDNDYYKKKYKSVNKNKIYISILEILAGASGVVVGSTLTATGVGTQTGVPIAGVSSLVISVAVLFTNEYFSRLKSRYQKLRVHIKMIKLLYEKTLKKSLVDKKIDEKESEELKSIYNHYITKRKEIIENTKFTVEDIFGKLDLTETISSEQIRTLNAFFSKNDVKIKIVFKPKQTNFEPSALPPLN